MQNKMISTSQWHAKLVDIHINYYFFCPDVILINEEFACNDELKLLSRDFGRQDSEFIGVSHDITN